MHQHKGAGQRASITGDTIFPKIDGRIDGKIDGRVESAADKIKMRIASGDDVIGLLTVIKTTGNTAERRSGTVAIICETTGRDGISRT